jgi:hypothetical protein
VLRLSRWDIEFHLRESIEIGDYASVAACLDYGYDWSFHSNPWGEKRKRKREFSPHHHHRFLPTGGGDHHQVDDYHEDDDDDLESIDYTLHHAVVLGNYRIVSMLLHSGAPLNIRLKLPNYTPFSATPLLAAARSGRVDIVELLLSRRADIAFTDQKGR